MAFIAPQAMADAIRGALPAGPVVTVVGNERDARRALALGVDEVLHVRTASAGALAVAVESARLRAMGRHARNSDAISLPGDPPNRSGIRQAVDCNATALAILATSLNSRLATPLAVALLNAEVLRATMPRVMALVDAYAQKAQVQGEDDSEAVGVVASRAAVPSSPELRDTVRDLVSALRQASAMALEGYRLVVPNDLETPCDLSAVVTDFAKVVRGELDGMAELRVQVPLEPCRAAISRSRFVHVLSALVGNAVRGATDRAGRASVILRVEPRGDHAIVAVVSEPVGFQPEPVPANMAKGYDPARGAQGPHPLVVLGEDARRPANERARSASLGPATTVRLSLPLAASALADAS